MRFMLYIASGAIMVMMAGLLAIFLVVAKYGADLPDYHQLADYEPKIVTRVHAGDGHLLAEFATEKRVFVPIDAIPKRVVNAFLAAEDKDFFKHGGVDPLRIIKAAITDVKDLHSKRRASGASTITQQVAKNMLLTNERTMTRKIKEAILAFRIEETFSKQRILELYLNQIYLGLGSYGVAAAGLNYFDKPLDELSISEAALLGAMPKGPSDYDPKRHPEEALARRNWVIDRMAEDGFITEDEAKAAVAEPIELHRQSATEFVQANYFTEDVRRQLQDMYGDEGLYGGGLSVRTSLDPTLQGLAVKSLRDGLVAYDQRHGWRGAFAHVAGGTGWEKRWKAVALPDGAQGWEKAMVLEAGRDATLLLGDGSHVTLSEPGFAWTHKSHASDLMAVGDVILVENAPIPEEEARKPAKISKKAKADTVVPEAAAATPVKTRYVLHQLPQVSGAMIAMDPHTGRVLAMVGGLSASPNEFNRATQANRQPGSSFKPFVYMAALDKGFTPSTMVEDAPIALSQGPGLPLWRPVNYEHDFLGLQPLRVGIEKSRNAMTVRIAEYIGMPAVVDEAKKFGILDNPAVNYSLAIGSGETTLLKMVTGYSEIVNGGRKIEPTLIDRVQDRNGKTLYRHDDRTCKDCMNVDWKDQPVPQPTGQVEQVETPQTTFQMVTMMQGVVQRGTAQQLNKLGYNLAGKTGTTNESKDVWFIGFTPDLAVGVFVGFDQPKSLGKHETGATTAVPIFGEFMKAALVGRPDIPFRIPQGVRMVRVDPSTGQPDFANPAGIWEAFIPGNEPGEDNFVVNGATLAARLNERGEPDAEEKDMGDITGGGTDASSSDDADSDVEGGGMATPQITGVSGAAPAVSVEENPNAIPIQTQPRETRPADNGSATMGTGGLY
jgi:penicillin-binding protein 1A